MITTKQPTDDMIEVAIVSMEQALVADGETVPTGSGDFAQRPMDLPTPADTATDVPAPTARAAGAPPRRRSDRPAAGAMSDLDAKLAEVARQYDEIQAELSLPETSTDPDRDPPARPGAVPARARRRGVSGGSRRPGPSWPARASCATPPTPTTSCSAMAREEIDRLEADETRLLEELKVLLLPRDPNDDRDVIMEIRGGAGGEEAALFAAELYRMYVRYAERHRFTPEVLSLNETGIGGIKEAILQIHGDGAYSRLKFEGGVHRVQRDPGDRVVAAGSTPRP